MSEEAPRSSFVARTFQKHKNFISRWLKHSFYFKGGTLNPHIFLSPCFKLGRKLFACKSCDAVRALVDAIMTVSRVVLTRISQNKMDDRCIGVLCSG